MALDRAWYLENNPDVLAEYYKVNGAGLGEGLGMGKGSKVSPEQFAQYHFDKYGAQEGRLGSAPANTAPVNTVVDPVATGTTNAYVPVADITTPTTNVPVSNTGQLTAPVGDPNDTLQAAIARQLTNYYGQAYSAGVDPNMYLDDFKSSLNTMAGYIPQGATNYSSYFDPNYASSFITGRGRQEQSSAINRVKSTFNPSYATSKISDSFLDNTINEILNNQYSEAQKAFDRGKARGQFNDVGYSSGIGGLNTAKTGAQAKLNSYEDDILSRYRGKINSVGTRANDAASGLTLGNSFNLDDYLTEADSIAKQFNTNAPGEFINTVGNENLFDLSSLLNKAGASQGAINLPNTDVLAALEERKQKTTATRGLGGQGAF
jgi:hypothetical protein